MGHDVTMSRWIRHGGEGMVREKWLPNDVERCNGVGSDDPEEGWREGCETCLRRTAIRPELCLMIDPPPIIVFECEYLIEPQLEEDGERLAERPEID